MLGRTTDHIGSYHNGEVAGRHLVPLLVFADLVQEPEEVLDVPVVLPGQTLVLQQVPHGVKPLGGVVESPGVQPVWVEVGPEERLREFPQVGLDGGGEQMVVSGLQAGQRIEAGSLKLRSESPNLPVAGGMSEESLLLQPQTDQLGHAGLDGPGDAAGEVEGVEVGGERRAEHRVASPAVYYRVDLGLSEPHLHHSDVIIKINQQYFRESQGKPSK